MPQSREHLGHGVGPAGEDGRRPVGDLGVAVDIDPEMLVVGIGPGEQSDLPEQIGGGQGAHAAQDADGLALVHERRLL